MHYSKMSQQNCFIVAATSILYTALDISFFLTWKVTFGQISFFFTSEPASICFQSVILSSVLDVATCRRSRAVFSVWRRLTSTDELYKMLFFFCPKNHSFGLFNPFHVYLYHVNALLFLLDYCFFLLVNSDILVQKSFRKQGTNIDHASIFSQ